MFSKGGQDILRVRHNHNPPPMRFQPRDGEILTAIYQNDGVLGRRHIKSMFWYKTSEQAMEHRLSLLYRNSYLDWPNTEQRRTKPIPEPIVWLGWKGALWIAGQCGIQVTPPTNHRENQMRLLTTSLGKAGIRWVREPRWIQLAHDLAIVDIRMAVEKSVAAMPALLLEEWLPEGEFRSKIDVVEFTTTGRDGKVIRGKKGVCPDSYFVVMNKGYLIEGQPARARFLLELDNATHANNRFGFEKVIPGIAYIKSAAYKARFGFNSGHWLVVTTGEVRMKNLLHQVREKAGRDAGLFYFTTFEKAITNNVFSSPIWCQVGDNQPKPLIVE
jgi:hypothetical protein